MGTLNQQPAMMINFCCSKNISGEKVVKSKANQPNQGYEFSGSQNSLIIDLANNMRRVGYFSIAVGLLASLIGLLMLLNGGFSVLPQGVTAFIIGYWTLNASRAFQMIVDTRGTDVEHLMGALGELRKLYRLQYWLLTIGLVFLLVFAAFVVFTSTSTLIHNLNYRVQPN
jgi:ABC-type multidrug transport system fused ATPase/permease subunit